MLTGIEGAGQRFPSSKNIATGAEVSDAGITGGKRLVDADHIRGAGFERARVGFVAGAVLEEDAIAGANRSLPVALRIPRDSDPRRGIKEVAVHATCRHSIGSALHNAIGDARVKIRQIQRNWSLARQADELAIDGVHLDLRGQSLAERLWLPVEGPQIFLVVVSK